MIFDYVVGDWAYISLDLKVFMKMITKSKKF